jgi:type VI secretion system protein ImpA
MATPEVLSLEELLAPVPGEKPTGPDPRAERRDLRGARTEASTLERQIAAGNDTAGKTPEWGAIEQKAKDLLKNRAKDLDTAAFLIEALVREYGFAGLRDGFKLVRELASKYWDDLHPVPNPEDGGTLADKVAMLAGLDGGDRDGTLIIPINRTPITAGQNAGPFSRADYETAMAIEQITDPSQKAARIDREKISLQLFELAVSESPPEFFRDLVADINGALDELKQMGDVIGECCSRNGSDGSVAPQTGNIRRVLGECLEIVQRVAKNKLEVASDAAAAETADTTSSAAGAAGAPGGNGAAAAPGQVRNREDAFRQIEQIARFFERTEPQGLVAVALRQAVRWGQLPLPDLLAEFVPEASARNRFEWIGVPPPKPKEEVSS